MAENLPDGFVPDASPPEGFVPDTAAPEGFIPDEPPDEPANINVGVMPMPSRAEHMAALAAAPTGQDTAPGAYTVGGPRAFAAYRAQHSGLDSAKAGEALQLSRATGLGPQFAADNAADLRAETDRAKMADGLAGAPALSAYVNQSAVHAAAAKESVGPLAALEQGLMDLGYQVAAEHEFESPGGETAGLVMSEADTAAYDRKESPWYADLLRSAPTLATYYLLGAGGKLIGGKAGEFGATAGAMFMLNRGTLYRQIIREMPIPASDEEAAAMGWKGTEEYEQRARTYATAGAGASAALGAGLSTAIGLMFPGAAPRAASLANGLIARAFTDVATRDIVQRLAQAGGHTLSGALMMAIPAVVDDATVQEAVRGHVDPGKAAVAGWEAFKKSLLAAGALSALPHILPIARDIGRINRAGDDAARLQSHVDQATKADLPPDEKREVIGRMVAQSDVPAVHVDPEHLSPDATQKLVETLADDGQSLAEAKALGVEVPVPTEKYLTDLADQHETLKQDVKLDPDGLTPRQADEARAGVQAQTDTLGSLMAARDYALQSEPESPERTAKLQDIEERMRVIASRGLGMPDTGKGTPEEVAAEMAKLEAEMRAADVRPAPSANLFEASFKNKETGEIIETGRFHDITKLPGGEGADLEKWEAGFNDAAGKFLTREEAKASLPKELQAYTSPVGLESEDLTPMLRKEAIRLRTMGDRTPQPPMTPEQAQALRRALEPKASEPAPIPAPELEDHAARAVEEKTIGELQPGRYERAAESATRKALAAHAKVADLLSQAEQTAQAGIEAGLSGIQAGQRGIREYKYIREAEWAKDLRSAVETADLGEINKTINDLIKRAQNDPNAALGAAQVDVLKNIKKTANAGKKWLEGLRTGTELSPETAAGGLYDVGGTQATGEPPQPGTPEFIAAQEHNIKFGEEEMRRASREAEKARKEAEAQSVRATKATVRAGELAAEAKAHEQARDLARAMGKKVGEVRAEMDGIRDRITDRFDDDKVRAYLNLADPAYRAATDSILGQLGLAPEVLGAQGIDGAVARMSNDARLLGFDAGAIRDILDRGRDWKSLTPAEARNVQDALTSIREAAKAETEVSLIDRKMNLREMVSLVGQHLFGGRPGGPPTKELPAPGAGEPESKATTAGRLIGEALQPREILRRLGPMGDAVYDLFVRSRNYKEELSRKVGAILNEAWSELPADLRKRRNEIVAGPGSPVVNDNAWTRQDLWMLAAWYGSESGAERLRNGLQITDEQILRAISQLSPAEAQFIDKLHALNDEHLWPLVQEHETRNTGTSAPKIQARPFTVSLADGEAHTFRGGYWPAKDAGPADPPPAETVADYWGTVRNGFPATSKSFTKERAVSASYRPDLRWQSYGNHLNTVLHYLAFDDFVREGGRLVRDKEFRDIVEQGLGPQAPTELDKFVQVAARGNVEAAKGGAEWWNRIVGGGARSLVATSAFRLNFPVVLGQFSHIPAAKAGLGLTWLDMAQGVGKTFMPSTWADAHARSEQLPYRWNGYGAHLREMTHNIGPQGERAGILRGLDVASSLPYHLMDGFLSHAIWRSMEARAERLGLAQPEIDRLADRAVAVMMPPLNLAEQSSVARDRGLIGSLLLVRNFPNTLFNVGAMRAWDARNAILSAEPGWQRAVAKVGAPTMAAASYLGTVWAAHIVGRFLMGHGRREDETTPQWLERDAIAAPFYPVPVLSEFGEPLATAITSKQSFGQAFLRSEADIQSAPMLAFMQGLVRNIGQAASSGRGSEDRVFAGLRTAATLFGTGAWPLKPARYMFDLQTGKVRPRGPFDVGGGFFYGQRPKQERNPFTVIQDIESGRFR